MFSDCASTKPRRNQSVDLVSSQHPPWRNWLARSTVIPAVYREVESSSLSGGVSFLQVWWWCRVDVVVGWIPIWVVCGVVSLNGIGGMKGDEWIYF
jgi:hypothetical protein